MTTASSFTSLVETRVIKANPWYNNTSTTNIVSNTVSMNTLSPVKSQYTSLAYHPFWSTEVAFYWNSLPILVTLCNSLSWLHIVRYNYYQLSLEGCGPACIYPFQDAYFSTLMSPSTFLSSNTSLTCNSSPISSASSSSTTKFTLSESASASEKLSFELLFYIIKEGYQYVEFPYVLNMCVRYHNLSILDYLLNFYDYYKFNTVLSQHYIHIMGTALPSMIKLATFNNYMDILDIIKDYIGKVQPLLQGTVYYHNFPILVQAFRDCVRCTLSNNSSTLAIDKLESWLLNNIYNNDKHLINTDQYTLSSLLSACTYNHQNFLTKVSLHIPNNDTPFMVQYMLHAAIEGEQLSLIQTLYDRIQNHYNTTQNKQYLEIIKNSSVLLRISRTKFIPEIFNILQLSYESITDINTFLNELVNQQNFNMIYSLHDIFLPVNHAINIHSISNHYAMNKTILSLVCKYGNIQLFEYLLTNYHFPIDADCLRYCINGGHYAMLQYLFTNYKVEMDRFIQTVPNDNNNIPSPPTNYKFVPLLSNAARNGHLEIIQYLLNRYPISIKDEGIFSNAILSGNIKLINYLMQYNQQFTSYNSITNISMRSSSSQPIGLGITACLNAIYYGSLPYIDYIHKQLHCPWDSKIYYQACIIGSIHHLQYFYCLLQSSNNHTNDVPSMDLALCEHGRYSNIIREWLKTISCPCEGKRCQA